MTARGSHEPGAAAPGPRFISMFLTNGSKPPYPRWGCSKIGAADATRDLGTASDLDRDRTQDFFECVDKIGNFWFICDSYASYHIGWSYVGCTYPRVFWGNDDSGYGEFGGLL